VFELHAEQPAGEFLQYRAGNFYAVLFAHKPPGRVSGPHRSIGMLGGTARGAIRPL
jgi:hypothetical protein